MKRKKEVRLLTYNVLYEGAADGLYPELGAETDMYSWENRRDSVAETVVGQEPDIVAFQEVWLGQSEDLRGRLPEFGWVGRGGEMEHTPIAYRKDRFAVVDEGAFWLSEPDAEPGEAGWDASNQRLVTHATFREADGSRLAVFSVHLDHEGELARREGARLVREEVTGLTDDETPAVVAGDFNCEPGSEAYEKMTEEDALLRNLRETRASASVVDGPKMTFTGLHEEDDEDEMQIDHAFVTDQVVVERHTTCVPDSEREGFRPSDHRPVVVDLRY